MSVVFTSTVVYTPSLSTRWLILAMDNLLKSATTSWLDESELNSDERTPIDTPPSRFKEVVDVGTVGLGVHSDVVLVFRVPRCEHDSHGGKGCASTVA